MLTPEQYLERERAAQDVRSEYYNGRMYSMSGGSHPHAIVIGNLGSELGIALKKSSCVVTTSDMRVRVSKTSLYTYPDIVVVCDPPQYGDGRHDTILNPALIVEVLFTFHRSLRPQFQVRPIPRAGIASGIRCGFAIRAARRNLPTAVERRLAALRICRNGIGLPVRQRELHRCAERHLRQSYVWERCRRARKTFPGGLSRVGQAILLARKRVACRAAEVRRPAFGQARSPDPLTHLR